MHDIHMGTIQDSEARLNLLRARSGGSKRLKNKGDDVTERQPVAELTTISTSSGHINLFSDIEQVGDFISCMGNNN